MGVWVLGAVVIVGGALLALAVASENGFFHGRLPVDTLAKTEPQAEDVAFSVASDAGCGEFDSEAPNPDVDTWWFTCRMNGRLYGIWVYGSDQARSAGLAKVRADGRPYVTKAYYAVTIPRQGVDKLALMSATPPPASIMDPFR